jgi:hypothetical protein
LPAADTFRWALSLFGDVANDDAVTSIATLGRRNASNPT